MASWSQQEIDLLKRHYPLNGKMWCASFLNKTESSIRWKASELGLKQNIASEFFIDWQKRAANSKIGKKRPEQAAVMIKNHADGKLLKNEEHRKAIGERTKKWLSENEHPKGMLGKKHSKETIKILSEKTKKMFIDRPELKSIITNKGQRTMVKNGTRQTMNRSNASWKAGWREIGGIKKYYRSRWEANYARYLEWLKKNNKIKSWEHEPKTFWFDGIKRGCLSYLPDFLVIENNDKEVYHEVKGWMDDRSKTKIKRMAKYHPLVKLIVIEGNQYKQLAAKLSSLIAGWE